MLNITKTYNPKTLDEALKVLNGDPDARVCAGGTDLLVALKRHKIESSAIVNINDLPELKGVKMLNKGTLWIGPCTDFDTLYRNDIIKDNLPMLSSACNMVGGPQIRHIGTIGGNLAKGAVSADSVPSLLCYDALLTVKSIDDERIIPVTEFHTGPGKTVLKPNEIITGILIKKENYENYGGSYLKFGQRNALEIATLCVGSVVRLTPDKKKIETMKMAFGVAAPTPRRVFELEKNVSGMEVSKELFDYVKENVLISLSPRDSKRASKEFREQLIKVQSVRSLKNAIINAGGELDV